MIDLMCVLMILGLLFQLLLPAVHAARESSRRLRCGSHLRELGLAALAHQQARGFFPSGGWHFHWVGEPERGTGPSQPGSWAFNLLDYLGETDLRQVGTGLSGQPRYEALRRRCRTPIRVFHCPSRRAPRAYPHRSNQYPFTRGGRLKRPLQWAAKTDYAANVGDSPEVEFDWRWPGPQTLTEGDQPRFSWPQVSFSGVIYGRSKIRPNKIQDGLSKTYLLGEKFVDARHYASGKDWGDNENLYSGFNNDNCRSTSTAPQADASKDAKTSFGSAHAKVWQAVYCDGSVHALSFDVDPQVHRRLGNRRNVVEGQQVPRPSLIDRREPRSEGTTPLYQPTTGAQAAPDRSANRTLHQPI